MPNMEIVTGDSIVSKTKSLPLWSMCSIGEESNKHTVIHIVCQLSVRTMKKKKHKAIEGDRVESIILERVIKEDLLQ
jgi:hypothetical protein